MSTPSGSELAQGPGRAAVLAALALVYVVWGSTYLGIHYALEGGWPPLWLPAARNFLAGLVLYVVLRLRGEAAPTPRQWRSLIALGVLLLSLGNGLVCVAQQTVSSGIAAVAVASAPIWMGIFGSLRGIRPSRVEWVGIAIGFVGVAWLDIGGSLKASPLGLVCLLIAPLAWAWGSIWSKGRDLPSPFMTAAGQLMAGGGVLLVVAPLLGEPLPHPDAKGWAAFAYLVLMGSIVGFTAYVWLLKNVRPTLASSYAYVNPVIAVVLGAAFAGERFHGAEFAAMGVILLGVVAITLAKAKPAGSPKPG